MNYYDTLIEIADDCPTIRGQVPQASSGKKTKAVVEYELLVEHPYTYVESPEYKRLMKDPRTTKIKGFAPSVRNGMTVREVESLVGTRSSKAARGGRAGPCGVGIGPVCVPVNTISVAARSLPRTCSPKLSVPSGNAVH